MLYLAQVNNNPISGEIELQFLAHQQAENSWQVSNSFSLPYYDGDFRFSGLLVLVELAENQEIIYVKLANDLLLNLLKKHLLDSIITPEFIEIEKARVEQWRQEITAQNLDLTRRNLEIETRRDQLQELEISLKLEKEKLEARWQQLHQLQEELKLEKENLKDSQQKIQE
jgi:hypothetical protein